MDDDEEMIIDPADGETAAARAEIPAATTSGAQPETRVEGPTPGTPPPVNDMISPPGTRTRSARKKRKQEQEEQQQQRKAADDANPEADYVKGDDKLSDEPQGPRRKRARLAASAATTGDEEEESGDEDDDGTRSSLEGEESKSGRGARGGDSKRAAVERAPDASGAAAEAVPMRFEGGQLRLPAHQTPGKAAATVSSVAVRTRMGVAETVAAAAASTAVGEPSRRRFELGTTVAAKPASQAARQPAPTVTLKPPPSSSGAPTSDAHEDEVHDKVSIRQLLEAALKRFVDVVLPNFVFWLLLLGFTQYLLGVTPRISFFANRTAARFLWPQPVPASSSPANETLLARLAELEQIHENLIQDLRHTRQEIDEDMKRFMDERSSLVTAVQDHAASLQHKFAEVSDAIQAAQAHPLVHEHDLTVDQIASHDIQTLQSLVRGSIVDVSFLSSWQSLPTIEEMSCPVPSTDSVGVSQELRDAAVAALRTKAQQLQLAATVSAIEVTGNKSLEETYRSWIRQEVLEYEDEDGVVPIGTDTYDRLVERNERMIQVLTTKPGAAGTATQIGAGPSEEAIQKIINARMELERADQTGRVDYASVLNGASVIRGGERGTSPSLVDQLPLANRLARLWSIRHYGHGPAAALTPTNPPFTALGQCWSFTKDLNPAKQSGYATLTVQLAKPVGVRAVSVEHPPQDITDRIQTAIQNFRVVGYEFPNAQGMAWPLGSFEYRVGGDIRQEFVAKTEVKGETVPVLQSVSLLIDSNWGANYTCLYRFRVFGNEE